MKTEKEAVETLARMYARLDRDHNLPRHFPDMMVEATAHADAARAANAMGRLDTALREWGWALFRLGCSI